ncbi:MAG TPA: hypothetical protein VGK22_03365 [Candidatus Angelobacter sp.]
MATSEHFGRTALSVFETKDALLYFKHVIPLTYIFDVFNDNLASRTSSDTPLDVFDSPALRSFVELSIADLIPPEFRTDDFYQAMWEIGNGHLKFLFSSYWHSKDPQKKEDITQVAENFIGPAKAMLKKFPISDLPAVVPPSLVSFIPPENSADIVVTLASLKLVDTNQTSLQQIYEFRRDEDAAQKLRRIRLFAYDNYRDKPRTFIEDDLLARISDYEHTVKKWGFETKASMLTTLLDSKLIAGGIVGSFLSSYLDSPLLTAAATLGTTGITIGKIAVELGRQRFAHKEMLADNPVSYIAYANEKLTP